jgi:hypothetical protein
MSSDRLAAVSKAAAKQNLRRSKSHACATRICVDRLETAVQVQNRRRLGIFLVDCATGESPIGEPRLCVTTCSPLPKGWASRNGSGGTRFVTPTQLCFRSLGVEFKVMQELMRHSSLRSRLDVYTQAVGPAKRTAQARSTFTRLLAIEYRK